jgi:hypothetical protein
MHDRLIDILFATASKMDGTLYVTLDPKKQNWCISNNQAPYCGKLDRDNLKYSIRAEVFRLATLLPKVEIY